MTDMYEAGETLARVQQIVVDIDGKAVTQTPDGKDPVYWPITVYGRTGMVEKKYVNGVEVNPYENDPKPLMHNIA